MPAESRGGLAQRRRIIGLAAAAVAIVAIVATLLLARSSLPGGAPPVVWQGTPVTAWGDLDAVGAPIGAPAGSATVAWHEGYVAIAATSVGGANPDGFGVWRSPDGVTWRPTAARVGQGAQSCSMAGGGAGLLAVCSTGSAMTAWSSADGDAWAEAAGFPSDSSRIDVAAGDRGFVAVGLNTTGAPGYFSADGHQWEPVVIDAGGTFYDAAAGHDGFVVVGESGGVEAIWTSSDGRRWARARLPNAHAGGKLHQVGVAGGGVMANGEAPDMAIAWTSKNAVEWVALDVPPVERMSIAASDGTRIITLYGLNAYANESVDGATSALLPSVGSVERPVIGIVAMSPDGLIAGTSAGWEVYRKS